MAILSLVESVFMRLSLKRHVDGLWVGVLGSGKDEHLLDRVEEALMLIKRYDAVIYRQVHRYIARIWINPMLAAAGQFNLATGTCGLDDRYVKSASAESIASTIVHETTHAHPCMRKLGYPEAMRYRIEQICMRRQLAFVSKLPDSTAARAHVEYGLSLPPSYWLPESGRTLRAQSAIDHLREVEIPTWLIGIVMGLHNAINRIRDMKIWRSKN